MDFIELTGLRHGQVNTLGGDNAQTCVFEFLDNRTGQVAACCVWFDDRECALKGHVACSCGG